MSNVHSKPLFVCPFFVEHGRRRQMECPLKKKACRLCSKPNGVLYCGQKYGENRIAKMKKCPLPEKKRDNTRRRALGERRVKLDMKHYSICPDVPWGPKGGHCYNR